MRHSQDVIPHDHHAALTEALKIACAEQYNRIRLDWGKDSRALELASTLALNKPLLQKLVSFLTMGKIDYDNLVESHKSPDDDSFWRRLFGSPEIIREMKHAEAMMDLRRVIAEQDSNPWLESHVHFWRELDAWVQTQGEDECRAVDNFFDLLSGKSFSALTENHRLTVDSSSSHAYQEAVGIPYVFCEDLDRPLREDCAGARYSAEVGAMENGARPTLNNQGVSGVRADHFDIEYLNSEFSGGPDRLHPRLKKFEPLTPSVRGESLSDVLSQVFKDAVAKDKHKQISIMLMDRIVISGYLTENSFTVKDVFPTSAINKSSILSHVKKAEECAGFHSRLDDYLAKELGL